MLAMSGNSPLDSSDSQLSLDSRSSHDEDPFDMSAPVDDRERLSLLDAAVHWIREELTTLHKCDESILKKLQSVHSSVRDLKDQQKSVAVSNRQLEKKFLYNSFEEEEDEKEEKRDVLTSFKFSLDSPRSPTSPKLSLDDFLNPAPTRTKPAPSLNQATEARNGSQQLAGGRKGSGGPRVLMDIGSDPGGRAVMVGRTSPSARVESPPSAQEKRMAELKAEAKKEGRSSVFFEMQMLRQRLQDTAKEELAEMSRQFDIEPPSVNHLEVSQEDDSVFNRYSIFGRMDQILQSTSSSSGHTRQYSEPVNLGSLSYADMHPPPHEPPSFGSSASVHRTNSEQYQRNAPVPRRSQDQLMTHHSLRHGGGGSSGSVTSVNSSGRKESTGSNSPEDKATHYNTAVIRGRKKSKNGTLEKKRNPLRYSVESLNESGDVGGDNVYDHLAHEPEYQNLPHSAANGGNSLPRYYSSQAPRSHNPLIHSRSEMGFTSSAADVHPEVPSTAAGDSIQPYMTVGQLRTEMDAFQNSKKQFVYTPYAQKTAKDSRKPSLPAAIHTASSSQHSSSSHSSSSSHHQKQRINYLPSERTWL